MRLELLEGRAVPLDLECPEYLEVLVRLEFLETLAPHEVLAIPGVLEDPSDLEFLAVLAFPLFFSAYNLLLISNK